MTSARRRRSLPAEWVTGLRDLAALVLPVDCAGCGRGDVAVCPACRASLRAGPLHARPPAPGAPPVLAATRYDGTVRSLLVAWKDRGRLDVGGAVAEALALPLTAGLTVVERRTGEPVLLVPVPSSRPARRRRGADVVAVAARRAAAIAGDRTRSGRRAGAPEVATVLRQRRGVRDQAGLGAAGRAENLLGAVRLVDEALVAGRVCVAVDDVVTTGATLAAVAEALCAGGAVVPLAVTVAATPRRRTLGRPGAAGRATPLDHGSDVSLGPVRD